MIQIVYTHIYTYIHMYKFSERPCAYLHGCMCLQRAPSAEEAKYNIFYDIYPIHVYKFCERPCAYLVLTLCVLAAGTVRIHTYIPPGVVDRWAVDRYWHKYCLYSFPMKVKTRKAFKRSQGVPRAANPERHPKGMCVTCLCLVFAYQGPGCDL